MRTKGLSSSIQRVTIAGAWTLDGALALEHLPLWSASSTARPEVFTLEATQRAFDLTDGQPWLLNALARELVVERAQAITEEDVDTANDVLIRRQDTHLDSFAERLRESRVRRVIEPGCNR